MLIKRPEGWEEHENAVTSEWEYLNRRKFLAGSAAALFGAGGVLAATQGQDEPRVLEPLTATQNQAYGSDGEALTAEAAVTRYNNFYEFGIGKDDPIKNAWRVQTDPWSVTIDGHCAKPGTYAFEDLIPASALQERIYRLRCVEAWSMVIPWIGVPLAEILKRAEPTADARYVRFETLYDRKQMPGTRWPVIDWPYTEGLRMDEAMNDLAFLATGLYGKQIPNQNGAPLRLVLPWKYGFKSIKSIVRISFEKDMPKSSWMKSAPQEYGFYANVNPEVSHPRWSQARERRIGEFGRRDTLKFNGYGEQVAHLYKDMDLARYY